METPGAPGPPPRDDALLWEFSASDPGGRLMLASTLEQGTIYAASGFGRVYALNAKTGELRWSARIDDQLSPPPVVVESAVYLEGVDDYYALDASTGDRLETTDVPDKRALFRRLHRPATATAGGRSYHLRDSQVYAVDLATESQVWTYDTGAFVPLPPVAWNGMVFARSHEGAHALDGSTGELVWISDEEYGGLDQPPLIVDGVWPLAGDGVLRARDAATGQLLWSFDEDIVNSVVAVADGMILAYASSGFYALDAATGEVVWGLGKDWNIYQVTVADGIMYANTVDGYLHAVNVQTGVPLWSIRIGHYLAPEYGLYRVADGVVYVTHETGVHAYKAPDTAYIPTPEKGPAAPNSAGVDPALSAVLHEAFDNYSRAERDCIDSELGEGFLEELLRTHDFGDPGVVAMFDCLEPKTADSLMSNLITRGEDLGQEAEACIEKAVANLGAAKLMAAITPDAGPKGQAIVQEFHDNMTLCMEEHLRRKQPQKGTGPPPAEESLLWEFSTGNPDALVLVSPDVVQGVVYAASSEGRVYALDADTGELLWNTRIDAELDQPPLPVGSEVYVPHRDGDYSLLDASSGELLRHAVVRNGVAVRDGTAYVITNPPGSHRSVRALDVNTGELLVEFDPRTLDRSTIEHYEITVLGDQIYVEAASGVHALDTATGSLAWSFNASLPPDEHPAASNGVVYIRSFSGAHALDETTGEELWRYDASYGAVSPPLIIVDGVWPINTSASVVGALDVATGRVLWSFVENLATIVGGADGTVFVLSQRGLYGFDAATGEEMWRVENTWHLDEVTLANGVLYGESEDGYLRTFDAQTGEPIWSLDIGYQHYARPGPRITGRPFAVSGGVLYLGYRHSGVDSGVYAYAAPAGSAAPSSSTSEPASEEERLTPPPVETSDGSGPPRPEDALLWEFSTGRPAELVMSHTLSKGRIYAASPQGQVYAVDAETGALLWSAELTDLTELKPPPVPAGEAVYIEYGRGDYFALDPKTGEPLPRDDDIGRVRGAAVRDGTAHITSVFRDGRIKVRAVDANTGDLLWQTYPHATIRNPRDAPGEPHAPAVNALTFQVTVLGERIYITDESRLHAFDAATGNLLWNFDAQYRIELPPRTWDGLVYVHSSYGAHALDEATGEQLWRFEGKFAGWIGKPYIADDVWPVMVPSGSVRILDATTGESLWSYQEGYATLIADGMAFMHGPEVLHALDAATGKEIWSLGGAAWGLIFNTTLADGVLYAESSEGYLHAFNAHTGEPIWSIEVNDNLDVLGWPPYYRIWDGVVYVTDIQTDTNLYAYAAPEAR